MLRVNNVLDIRTGRVFETEKLLNTLSEQDKHKLRAEQLGPKSSNYACPICDQKVYLSGTGKRNEKIYHFRHYPNNGECPLKGCQNLTREDWRKIIYNGAKESERHRNLKIWLGNFLKTLEPKGKFANSKIEARITSAEGKKHWRQPDVSCTYEGKPLVFELQLNNTFVDVIQGREEFYDKEHTYICWLFDGFNPYDTAFGQRDIFWLNKSNAFAITEETMRLSEENGDLMIECHYSDPFIEDGKVRDLWVSSQDGKKLGKIISFSELELKEGYYKPFYFDTDNARKKLELQLLVQEFEKYMWGFRRRVEYPEKGRQDNMFLNGFKTQMMSAELPDEVTEGFMNILDALYFLKTGKTENMNNNFINNPIKQFTNQILEYYPQHGYIYCMAVRKYRPDCKSEQLGTKLKDKISVFWKTYKAAEKKGKANEDKRFDSILRLLFPELKEFL